MKKNFSKQPLIFVCLIFCSIGGILYSQTTDRYFDTAEQSSKEVRIAVCYPSIGSIKSLVELKKQGFFPIEHFIVIGVYHEKERTDYQRSKEFVKEQNLEWFRFHKISEELTKDVLFQKNSCTDDFEVIFRKSDGVIFFGGADIPPSIFKKKTNLLTSIRTPFRHFLELSFVFHLLGGFQDENFKPFLENSPQFPVLGICLGCQSLNVGTGGTLIQDIPSEMYGKKYFEDVIALGKEYWHRNPFPFLYPEEKLISYNMHRIKLAEKGKFCSELGFKKNDTPYILSGHHQMVEELGRGIKIAATSLDGKVVEAIEHEKYPNFLGVQFHPENPILWNYSERFRFSPKDKEEINLRTYIEDNPPSSAFHKKIWDWFGQKIEEFHKSKK